MVSSRLGTGTILRKKNQHLFCGKRLIEAPRPLSLTGPGKELTGAFGEIEFLLCDAAALIFSISVGTRAAVAAAGRRVLRLPVPSGRRAALRHG